MKRLLWPCILTALITGCQKETEYKKPLVAVKVQTVENGTEVEGPKYSGNIVPATRVDMAFRFGGYVEELLMVNGEGGRRRPVQEGDQVHKGDVLARVKLGDYVAKVNQAKSQIAQAEAGLEQTRHGYTAALAGRDKAKLDFDRASHLFQAASLTKIDFDGAKAAQDAAQATLEGVQSQIELGMARVEGARALLEEANLALADAALKAPMDGLVVKRLVEIGSLVGPGTPGFVLTDARQLNVMFGAPDTLLPHVQVGTELKMNAEALGRLEFLGRVTRVSPVADPKSRVFDVELAVPEPDPRLKLGMIATIQFPSPKRDVLPVVPLTAIVKANTQSSGYAVFVVTGQGGNGVCHAREVQLGDAVGNQITVREGLKAGELVIVTGAPLVQDGQTVRIIP